MKFHLMTVLPRKPGAWDVSHWNSGCEMAQASLAAANLVSRSDIEALDERLGRVEDGLVQVSAELSKLRQALVAGGAATAPAKPARDRKAPAATQGKAPAAPGKAPAAKKRQR